MRRSTWWESTPGKLLAPEVQLQPVTLPVHLFLLTSAFVFLELFSEIISKEVWVFITHSPVHITEALKMGDRELAGAKSRVHICQL